MITYMRRLLAGEIPSDEELAEYLAAFHREVPAATPAVIRLLHDAQGRTSYDIVAERCARGLRDGPVEILDIGCGDGALIPSLHVALPDAKICGVDLSSEEIVRARAAFANERTAFVQARAQRLPFADATFDGALSHLALMLMQPVVPAFREIARVLRPGGALTFVTSTFAALSGDLAALMSTAQRFMRERFPSFAFRGAGDARMIPEAGLRDLLSEGGLKPVEFTDFEISGELSADGVIAFFDRAYIFGSLPGDDRALLCAVLRKKFDELGGDRDAVHIRMPLRLGRAQAPLR